MELIQTIFLIRILDKLIFISIHEGRTRLKLNSPNPDGRTAGFVTLATKSFESKVPGSTDSTPVHKSNVKGGHVPRIKENGEDLTDQKVIYPGQLWN